MPRVEHAAGRGSAVAQQRVHLCTQRRRDTAGKQHRIDDAGANDAEQDFLRACERDIEDGRGMIDLGQADQRHRVGRQQKDVAARRAIQQREVEQGADPQRHRQAQHDRLLGKGWQQHDRRGGAEQCAQGSVDPLRACRAGQRVRHDIYGGHRPVRVFQGYRQCDVQRHQGGNQRLGREQPFAPGWHGHRRIVREAWAKGGRGRPARVDVTFNDIHM